MEAVGTVWGWEAGWAVGVTAQCGGSRPGVGVFWLWALGWGRGSLAGGTLSPAWLSARTSQGEWHSLGGEQGGPSRLSSRGEDIRVRGSPVLCEGGDEG